MPTTNLRKHTIPAGADKSFNRATIFEAFGNSIHDIVPVANATERAQLVAAMNSKGVGPTATNPLFVYRADAPGLHRIEYSANGTVWLSDVLTFASKSDADGFGAANGGLLTRGDEARVGMDRYLWSGTAWVIADSGWLTPTFQNAWITAAASEAVEIRKKDGLVFLKGRPALGTQPTAFTLPEGWRPKSVMVILTPSATGSGGTTTVTVNTSGTVVLVPGSQPYLSNVPPFPAE